jgi:hypothetical protein
MEAMLDPATDIPMLGFFGVEEHCPECPSPERQRRERPRQ